MSTDTVVIPASEYFSLKKSTAWCECGDALEEVIEPDAKGERVVGFKYYCFGCDKFYKLVEVK